uniref:ABC transporter permease n=1 Tax=Ignisphaera aggregans TaxID=334771 RepID=A0A7C2V9H5_9CREN
MTMKPLVVREVKAFLRNPAFIISIILLFSFYTALGRLVSTGVESATEQVAGLQIGVVLQDQSDFATRVLAIANQTSGGRLRLVQSIEKGVGMYDVVLVIPPDFSSRALDINASIRLESFVRIDTVSPVVSGAKTNIASSVGELIGKSVSMVIAIEKGIDPALIEKSVTINTTIQVYGKIMRSDEYSAFTMLMGFVPMIVALIMGINAIYASQFTAMEKVEKAFEMLLAQPIPRRNIVFAKILGSIISSFIMGAAYFAGMLMLLSSATTSAPGEGASEVSLNILDLIYGKIGFNAILIFVAALVLGLIYSGAIGVALGSIVSDERIAGAFAAPIMFVFMGLGYALIFIGLPVNIATGILAGLVIAPLPAVAMVASMTGNAAVLATSLGVAALSTILVMALSVHIFNRDIVVLGLRLRRPKLGEKG